MKEIYVVTSGEYSDYGIVKIFENIEDAEQFCSCESIEHYDICPRCINKFVADYLGNENASLSAYIEIETEHVCYDEVM